LKKKIKGFTLIELMVVVAVIGALAAVGVVSYNGYVEATKKKSATNMMMQFALAQTEELTNTGAYWSQDDCDDPTAGSSATATVATFPSTGTTTQAIGKYFFNNKGYIEHSIGYDFCTLSTTVGYTIVAQSRKSGCKLTLDETTVVTENGC